MKTCTKCKIEKNTNQFNKDKSKIDGFNWWCKECAKQNIIKYRIKLKKLKPWYNSYFNAKKRCNNSKHNSYKNYGQRGIKFLLNQFQVEQLWIRDKAYSLKRPSLDRIDNDGDYIYDNCRFIELSENIKKSHVDKKLKI